ncbi:MAG TPA: class E sortase [Acidimicrobiales bacterium]|nr:class E sortase [Acidimicrobiales bacterium]
MTSTSPSLPLRLRRLGLRRRGAEATHSSTARPDVVPLTGAAAVVRAALVIVSVLTLSLVLELVFVSPLQARAAQQRKFDQLRHDLAAGTAPLAAGDLKGKVGAPVSFLQIPAIGLRQVVVEGTSAGQLFQGPGHRRDTALPGQAGISVVMGRRAAFGGPFARIPSLKQGDPVKVTTGAGVFEYRVIDVRRSGDPAPPALKGTQGRLALVTADGPEFAPNGIVIADADLVVPGFGGKGPLLSAKTLPDADKLMAVDLSSLWRLVLWLQALIAAVLLALVAWVRWHRAKTWIVFLPMLLLVGLMTAGELARVLPNLL